MTERQGRSRFYAVDARDAIAPSVQMASPFPRLQVRRIARACFDRMPVHNESSGVRIVLFDLIPDASQTTRSTLSSPGKTRGPIQPINS